MNNAINLKPNSSFNLPKTVAVKKEGYTFQMPQLIAEMMKINNQKSGKAALMPLDQNIGTRLNVLA